MKKLILILLIFVSYSVYADKHVELFGVDIPVKYYDYLQEQCIIYGVPIIYVARLIQWESGWDALAINKNPNGTIDKGIMAHNSAYIEDFALRYNKGIKYDPFNWKDSIRIGVNHLSVLRKNTGSYFGMICAYNMGLGGFKKWVENKRSLPQPTFLMIQFVFG